MSETPVARLAWRVGELSELIGVSEALLYREISLGNLPAVRLAEEALVVLAEDLDRYMQARRVKDLGPRRSPGRGPRRRRPNARRDT